MRRTATRPFTQLGAMSNLAAESTETVGINRNGFKLDLRDECTATAKLEKLK